MTGKDHTFDFITVGVFTYNLYLFRESDVYVSQAEGVPLNSGLLHLQSQVEQLKVYRQREI